MLCLAIVTAREDINICLAIDAPLDIAIRLVNRFVDELLRCDPDI